MTDLPNRRSLLLSIEKAITLAQNSYNLGAIFYIDLDRFKEINDSYGHASGDRFLIHVARRLGEVIGAGYVLARIAGDEFVLVAQCLGSTQDQAYDAAAKIGRRIQEALNRPFVLDQNTIDASGSIGITLLPKVGDTSDSLLQEADMAMYRAKHGGRNRIAFFESALRAEDNERRAIKADLKQALDGDQLKLHIQAQFDRQNQLVGAEALLRWNDVLRGAIPPAKFISIAEESDLIIHLGMWVLEHGCRMLVDLHGHGQKVPLSINVSPRQFRHPDFVEQVRKILTATGAAANFLIFEVTEGLLIEELDSTVERMNELASIGIRFSIDDFGTGYSSFKYLRQLPLYEIKIDQSFINDIPASEKANAIVQSILSMAQHLQLHVVAEGVETRAQANFLQGHACDAMQGYLFARPMPIEKFYITFG